jgi:hypothetical protein
MSFMDRAKAAAEQMKAKAQEGVGEVQVKKELAQAYWDLGHKAHELASAGKLSHPELDPLVQHISDLEAREGAGAPGGDTPGPGTPDAAAPGATAPPASDGGDG